MKNIDNIKNSIMNLSTDEMAEHIYDGIPQKACTFCKAKEYCDRVYGNGLPEGKECIDVIEEWLNEDIKEDNVVHINYTRHYVCIESLIRDIKEILKITPQADQGAEILDHIKEIASRQ